MTCGTFVACSKNSSEAAKSNDRSIETSATANTSLSSSDRMDFAELLFPEKNAKHEYVHIDNDRKVTLTETRSLKISGTTVVEDVTYKENPALNSTFEYEIRNDGIYKTRHVTSLKSGETLNELYAQRVLIPGKQITYQKDSWTVDRINHSMDTEIGKLSPCVTLKLNTSGAKIFRYFCRGYGAVFSDEKYDSERNFFKIKNRLFERSTSSQGEET